MKKRTIAFLLSVLLLLCLLSGCAPKADVLCVTVLDVGDCILLSLGNKHMLIDTGPATSRDLLLGELDRLDVDDLEAILITHPHEDHYGNARVLLETRTVGALFVPQAVSDELGYTLLLEIAAATGVKMKTLVQGDSFSLNGAVCEVFCPLPNDPEPNNAGLVLRVRYGTCRLLFTGDAEWAAEAALLARDEDWKCDFLKVGHHGSKTACSAAFLQAVAPSIAAISCAMDNDYGFSHEEVLDGLAAIGADIYRTDTSGTLHFVCDGTSVIYEE